MADEPDIDDTEQTVLIRIVEWTEWIPGHPDQSGMMNMHNGVTGFASSASEKLLEVGVMGTGKNLDFEAEAECEECDGDGNVIVEVGDKKSATRNCEKCEGTGKVTQKVHYGLYAMQATLAQNVSEGVLEALRAAQNLPLMERFEQQRTQGRDKRGDLVIVENQPKPPPPPPRRKRKR